MCSKADLFIAHRAGICAQEMAAALRACIHTSRLCIAVFICFVSAHTLTPPPSPTTPPDISCRVFAAEASAVIQHLPSLADEGSSFFEAASAGNIALDMDGMEAEETGEASGWDGCWPEGGLLYLRGGGFTKTVGEARERRGGECWIEGTVGKAAHVLTVPQGTDAVPAGPSHMPMRA